MVPTRFRQTEYTKNAVVTLNGIGDAVNVLTESQAKYPNGATLVLLTVMLRKQGDSKKADELLTDWVAAHLDDIAVRMA